MPRNEIEPLPPWPYDPPPVPIIVTTRMVDDGIITLQHQLKRAASAGLIPYGLFLAGILVGLRQVRDMMEERA